jgi:hypothetical protein
MNRSLLAASVLAALALPAAAGASTVTGVPDPTLPTWTDATFAGGSGSNDVTLTSTFTWTDAAQPLTGLGTCTPGPVVTCPYGPANVQLGGGGDRFTNTFYSADLAVDGGPGDDTITANGNTTAVHGGDDGDTIDVLANGAALAWGDNGHDHLRGAWPHGLGARLYGGWGPDLIVGAGTFGNDLLQGDQDDDQLFAVHSGGKLDGGAGNDTLIDMSDHDSDSDLIGGAGADTIVGSAYVNRVDAGNGADVIDVSGDDAVDTVTCGPGSDIVWADPQDVVARDCERVRSGPAPELGEVEEAVDHLHEVWPDVPTGDL